MQPKAPALKNDAPEEFEPREEWAHEKERDTLLLLLSGFRKDQLRVQLATSGKLKISGERPLENGGNKRSKFSKELQVPDSCDTGRISARLENGVLFVLFPKKPSQATQRDESAEKVAATVPPPTPPPPPTKAPESETQPPPEKIPAAQAPEKPQLPPAAAPQPVADPQPQTWKDDGPAPAALHDARKDRSATEDREKSSREGNVAATAPVGARGNLRSGITRAQEYQEMAWGALKEQGKLGEWKKLGVAVLLGLLLGMYVKNSFGPSQGSLQLQQ